MTVDHAAKPAAPPGQGKGMRAVLMVCAVAVLLANSSAARDSEPESLRMMATQGREVLVLPSSRASGTLRFAGGPIHGRSNERGRLRIHEVSFRGQTYRAATPLDGASSRIVFDPRRRRFVPMLSSIRVEVADRAQLDAVARRTGATGTTYVARLGVGFVELPESLHPVEAIERLKAVPGNPRGTIRLRRPPVKWL